MIFTRRELPPDAREAIRDKLRVLLSQRAEVEFACLFGRFQNPRIGFRDIDIGIWVDPVAVPQEASLEYEWELDWSLELQVSLPVDVKVLNYVSLGLQYAASRGLLLFARTPEHWPAFRERAWRLYLDFLPRSRSMLRELLNPDGTDSPV